MTKSYNLEQTTLFIEQFYQHIKYYSVEAGEETAQKFITNVSSALDKIKAFPFSYEKFVPQYNHEELAHLAFHKKSVAGFPFTVFYQVSDNLITIRCIYMAKSQYESSMIDDFKI